MSAAPRRGTTVATLILGAAALVGTVLLITLGGTALNGPAMVIAACAIGGFEIALALVVARGAPGDVTAPLLAAQGLIVILTNSGRSEAFPLLAGSWMLLYLPIALVLVIVPRGRAASPRWRAVAVALCAVVAAFILLCAAQATWPASVEALTLPGLGLLGAFLALLVACAAAPFARYRTADELDRLRLRWLLVAGLSLPLTLLLCWTSYIALGSPDLVGFGLVTMLLTIPAGATVALTRPWLFDIERVMSAAVAALALSAAGLVVLTIVTVAVGRPLTEWAPMPAALAAGTTTLAAVLAFPFARRGFERMLTPERGRAIARLRRLTTQVDAGVAAPEAVQQELREALRDPGLVVAYRRLPDRALVALDGSPLTMTSAAVPVHARGEEIGAIVPSALRSKRPAVAIARSSAALIDAVRFRAELARAAAEVEASRERLLRAGYDERRRLERDLHDGAQQRLVALGMQLRVLQRTSVQDPQVSGSLDAVVAELGTAVAELRRLAHGVRPSALDDGLGSALAELERLCPDTIELDVRAGELPDAVATTAYFVVSEAVANALRHAGADRIRVVVRQAHDELRVCVSDDGCGGAIARATGGLTGLSDRVRTLGGRLRLESEAGSGTTVEAVLPCAS